MSRLKKAQVVLTPKQIEYGAKAFAAGDMGFGEYPLTNTDDIDRAYREMDEALEMELGEGCESQRKMWEETFKNSDPNAIKMLQKDFPFLFEGIILTPKQIELGAKWFAVSNTGYMGNVPTNDDEVKSTYDQRDYDYENELGEGLEGERKAWEKILENPNENQNYIKRLQEKLPFLFEEVK